MSRLNTGSLLLISFCHNPAHYEDPALAARVKPAPWRSAWQQDLNKARSTNWRFTFVITKFEPFSIETRSVKKYDGTLVKQAPRNYVRILPPTSEEAAASWLPRRSHISEKNLETGVIENPGKVEPGLSLVERQLATPDAGRIDLLCKDSNGTYVVVELKKSRGSDQVVGQIQRYMGWVIENKGVDKVRGIIIVQRKDRRLAYAVRAAANIDVTEFGITFSSA